MSVLKYHYGWILRNGRRVCGAKVTGGLTARGETEVTCQGCLRWLAARAVLEPTT